MRHERREGDKQRTWAFVLTLLTRRCTASLLLLGLLLAPSLPSCPFPFLTSSSFCLFSSFLLSLSSPSSSILFRSFLLSLPLPSFSFSLFSSSLLSLSSSYSSFYLFPSSCPFPYPLSPSQSPLRPFHSPPPVSSLPSSYPFLFLFLASRPSYSPFFLLLSLRFLPPIFSSLLLSLPSPPSILL